MTGGSPPGPLRLRRRDWNEPKAPGRLPITPGTEARGTDNGHDKRYGGDDHRQTEQGGRHDPTGASRSGGRAHGRLEVDEVRLPLGWVDKGHRSLGAAGGWRIRQSGRQSG